MPKLKILYLAHRIPYPPNKGDKIRSFNEIKHLSQRHEIHLACLADNPNDLKYVNDLKKYCSRVHVERLFPSRAKIRGALSMFSGRSFSVGYFYSKTLQRVVEKWTSENRYDAIICFSSATAEYLFRSPIVKQCHSQHRDPCTLHRPAFVADAFSAEWAAPCLIMEFVDVDSEKWREYAGKSAFPAALIYWLESKLLLRYEKTVNSSFDYSVFVSKPEADLFLKLFPGAKNVKVISNGVDHEYFSPDYINMPSATMHHAPCTSNPIILFTGAMDYHANIDGVTWFCNKIFPLIRRNNPTAQFHIVGRNPTVKVKKLGQIAGVKVTGFVEDIRPFYRAADVCVVPLRLARGIQNKILEAMSMAKPVVTTAKALEGIWAISGEQVIVADKAESIAVTVVNLLKNKKKKRYLGENARQFVLSHFDWQANIKILENHLQKCIL